MLSIPKKMKSWLSNLRFPVLLLLTGTVFVLNVFIPDALPLADELLLALFTIILARMKRRKPAEDDGSGAPPANS